MSKLKIDDFKSTFDCKLCSKLLEKPVTLPCGVTICQKHIEVKKENKWLCLICNRVHAEPDNGFQINEFISKLLEMGINQIKLSPTHEFCKNTLEDLDEHMKILEIFASDPDNYVYSYFEELKRKVDLRRENLKQEIDEYSAAKIKEINQLQSQCHLISNKFGDFEEAMEEAEAKRKDLVDSFDSFEFNDIKYDKIIDMAGDLKSDIDIKLHEYKNSLLGNRDYHFKSSKLCIEDIFGSINISSTYSFENPFKDSEILTDKKANKLLKLCGFNRKSQWSLLYQASEDGFGAEAFHYQCDGKLNTLTVIEAENGCVFGGYLEPQWHSDGTFIEGEAFVYSLVSPSWNKSFKLDCEWLTEAAIGNPGKGAVFGNDYFSIAGDSNCNKKSFSWLYNHSMFKNSEKANSLLAGSEYFQVKNIEVFQKK